MRIVITGGAGFIGANLARDLAARSWVDDVVALDDLSTGVRSNLDGVDGVRLVEGTILDPEVLDRVLEGADAVVHLAAVPSVSRSIDAPVRSHAAIATGTVEVLEAARRAGGLYTVVSSSSSVYGANPTMPKSEDLRAAPLSPYAVAKLAAESYAIAYRHCYGLPTLAFRFFNVFGPLQAPGHAYAAVVPTFVDAALRGESLPVHGDGEQTRDFTFVGSVTSVVADALERRVVSDEPVNLAFGTRRSLNEFVEELGAQLGQELEVVRQPSRPGDVRHSQADQTRLQSLFPDVEPVAFGDGLAHTIEWFRGPGGPHG